MQFIIRPITRAPVLAFKFCFPKYRDVARTPPEQEFIGFHEIGHKIEHFLFPFGSLCQSEQLS